MYICTQDTYLWRLNNHFMKIQQAKWEPIQATVSEEYALIGALLFFMDLVIKSRISLELVQSGRNWKLVLLYRSVLVSNNKCI